MLMLIYVKDFKKSVLEYKTGHYDAERLLEVQFEKIKNSVLKSEYRVLFVVSLY